MDWTGATSFYVVVLLWLARVIIWTFICALLAWLGIRILDAFTPHIHERERIGENPISVGLFMGGFLILVGLVIHGVVTGPVVVGGGVLESLIIVNKLTPKIPFLSVEQSPIAVGIYVFGYLVFFGLIIHAALIMPL